MGELVGISVVEEPGALGSWIVGGRVVSAVPTGSWNSLLLGPGSKPSSFWVNKTVGTSVVEELRGLISWSPLGAPVVCETAIERSASVYVDWGSRLSPACGGASTLIAPFLSVRAAVGPFIVDCGAFADVAPVIGPADGPNEGAMLGIPVGAPVGNPEGAIIGKPVGLGERLAC